MKCTDKQFHYPGEDLDAMAIADNYRLWIFRCIAPYLGQNVIEVGGGIGSFSRMVLASNVDLLHVYEPSDVMFQKLQQNIEQDTRVTLINDFFTHRNISIAPDSLVYINVLEHVEKDLEEVKLAYRILKKNGHLIIARK